MSSKIVQSTNGITLVGGGSVTARDLRMAIGRAPEMVAADGGADRLLRAGLTPTAVIGDLDSLSAAAGARLSPDRLHRIEEQETTDFDKALRSIEAPFVLALGFAGARMDHGLAVFNTLVRRAGCRAIVIGPQDIAFAAPAEIALRLRSGDVLSLFPFAAVRGESEGLEWPIDGLDLAPDGRVGTSNRVAAGRVHLRFDRPGMVVILPRRRLDAAIRALSAPGLPDARGG
ncbi:MAG: thiamine diphosphokinase [Tabrizicola sp.]|nr:thiamine diphosphokinase [Tabrizicola sp.]